MAHQHVWKSRAGVLSGRTSGGSRPGDSAPALQLTEAIADPSPMPTPCQRHAMPTPCHAPPAPTRALAFAGKQRAGGRVCAMARTFNPPVAVGTGPCGASVHASPDGCGADVCGGAAAEDLFGTRMPVCGFALCEISRCERCCPPAPWPWPCRTVCAPACMHMCACACVVSMGACVQMKASSHGVKPVVPCDAHEDADCRHIGADR